MTKIKRLLYCDQPHTHVYEYLYSTYSDTKCNSKHVFDFYTLTHLFWPFLITIWLMHLPITNYAIILFVGIFTFLFELLENTEWFIRKYRSQEITDMGQSDYHGDSLLNLIGDTITNLIGIFMAIYISNKYVKWTILGILFGIITVVEPTYWNTFLTVLFFRSM
jgi:hypothetical protein